MTNSEKRRYVADAIRFYAHDSDESVYEFLKGYWPNELAEIIDPTCHVIPGKVVAELKDGTRLTGVLLSCGHAVFGVSAKDMPRFCCECGSRITSGGER